LIGGAVAMKGTGPVAYPRPGRVCATCRVRYTRSPGICHRRGSRRPGDRFDRKKGTG